MDIEYTLLENGFDFLISAINNISIAREDVTDEYSKKRLIKYSMLHLSSGIELIFKHRLLKENWTYIFADMNKANKHDFESGELKSVDSVSNIERLKNLCDILLTKDEMKILENLRKRRNKIEHFKIKESVESVEAIMLDALSIILNFIAKHTDLKSMSYEEDSLFDEIKRRTLQLEEVVIAREKIIEASAKNIGVYDRLLICPECLKKFLLIDDCNNKCLFCNYSDTPINVANEYINNVLGLSEYSCVTDGGDYPLYECFQCQEESLVFDHDGDSGICFNCDYRIYLSEDVKWCSDCGSPFNSINDSFLCENCLDYRFSKY